MTFIYTKNNRRYKVIIKHTTTVGTINKDTPISKLKLLIEQAIESLK